MGKVKGKHRLDKYYRLAKEHGYRSRASWKLVQLDSKFSFLQSSRAVLDLCAAPGGWMQVAVQRVPVGSLILGIDLVKIPPLRGALSIEQDITKPECRARVKKVMSEHGVKAFDLVLHDGSPNIGGAWMSEAVAQNGLVIDAVKLATQFLAPKGNFVTKVFRSQDYSSIIYCLNQLFEKVEVEKPAASRSASAEIFVLGLKYKAPAKIDPRLLDVKYLFQGSSETSHKVVDVLRPGKQKRHRDGYDDGESIVRKVSSAADFIWSDMPLEVLGSVTSIAFEDNASFPIRDHDLTTEEVKSLCDDLRVLGKQDFKHLLKWRMQIRKALMPSQKSEIAKNDADNKSDADEADKLLNEMEELTHALDRKKKREKKILAKRRAKDKTRKATGMQIDAMEDGYVDRELFSLATIKGKKDLATIDSAEHVDNDDLKDSDSEDACKESVSDSDSDEDKTRYNEHLEEILDQIYESFVSKREKSSKHRKRVKQAYGDSLQVDGDDDIAYSDGELDKDPHDDEANPLLVPLKDDEKLVSEDITNKWFSQDIFAKAKEAGDLGRSDSEDEMHLDNDLEQHTALLDRSSTKVAPSIGSQKNASRVQDDFEIVPAVASDSSDSSSDDSEDEDVDAKAEILATAKKMLRKKQREQMLDDAYNRYMFDDEGLPAWFLEEERRHRQPIKPVTKEEILAMKAQFKEINARPAKKVAEAKARKKRIAAKKLEKTRKKANAISDQTEISDRSKRKMIEQLYKKAIPKRPKKEYVVAKKGVSVRAGKGKVLVDRRMKKDSRGKATRRAKGKKNSRAQKAMGKTSSNRGSKSKNMDKKD